MPDHARGGTSHERGGGTDASRLELRLYVAAAAPNSARARANLQDILAMLSPDDYALEVIDCLSDPLRALRDGVLVTPTLVRAAPPPSQTIVGTLSDPNQLAAALGLDDLLARDGTYD